MHPPQSSLETPKKQMKNDPPSPHQERPRGPMWLQSWQISLGVSCLIYFCVSRSGGWLDKLLHSEAEECLWWTVHREDETQRCGQMPEGVYEFRWEMKPISQLSSATPRKHVNILQLWKAGLSFHEKHILQQRVKSGTLKRLLSSCLVTVENY